MKTLSKLAILIVLVSMVLCSACTKECDDKQTLDKYNIELQMELDLQQKLAAQYSAATTNQQKTEIMGQINTSLAKEAQVQQQINALKRDSKCL